MTFGWSRHLGSAGIAIGVDRFGASAPGEVIYEKLGLTPEAVVSAVKSSALTLVPGSKTFDRHGR